MGERATRPSEAEAGPSKSTWPGERESRCRRTDSASILFHPVAYGDTGGECYSRRQFGPGRKGGFAGVGSWGAADSGCPLAAQKDASELESVLSCRFPGCRLLAVRDCVKAAGPAVPPQTICPPPRGPRPMPPRRWRTRLTRLLVVIACAWAAVRALVAGRRGGEGGFVVGLRGPPGAPQWGVRVPPAEWLECAPRAERGRGRVAAWRHGGGRASGGKTECALGGAPVPAAALGPALRSLLDGFRPCACPPRTAGAFCGHLLPLDSDAGSTHGSAWGRTATSTPDADAAAIASRVLLCADCGQVWWTHGLLPTVEVDEQSGRIFVNSSWAELRPEHVQVARGGNKATVGVTLDDGRPAKLYLPAWFRLNRTQTALMAAAIGERRRGTGPRDCTSSASAALLCLLAWGGPPGGGEIRIPAGELFNAVGEGSKGPDMVPEGYYLPLNATCLVEKAGANPVAAEAASYGPWLDAGDVQFLRLLARHTPLPPPQDAANSTDIFFCIYVTEAHLFASGSGTGDVPRSRALPLLLALLPTYYTPRRHKFAVHVDANSSPRLRHSLGLLAEVLAESNRRAGLPRNLWIMPKRMSFRGAWARIPLLYMEASCWMFAFLPRTSDARGLEIPGPAGAWTHVVNMAGTDLFLWPPDDLDAQWLHAVRDALVRHHRPFRNAPCHPLAGNADGGVSFVGLHTDVHGPALRMPLAARPGSTPTRAIPIPDPGEGWRTPFPSGRLHRGPYLHDLPDDLRHPLPASRHPHKFSYIFHEADREDVARAAREGGFTWQLPPRTRLLPPLPVNPPLSSSLSQWHVLSRALVRSLLEDPELRALLLGAWRTRPIPDEGYVTTAALHLAFRRKLGGAGPGGEVCGKTLKYWDWDRMQMTRAVGKGWVEGALRLREAFWEHEEGGGWKIDIKGGQKAVAGDKRARVDADTDLWHDARARGLLALSARKVADPGEACELAKILGRGGDCGAWEGAEGECTRMGALLLAVGADVRAVEAVTPWEGYKGMRCEAA
ncbi:hypothetical protein DFJ74DRAFT_720174 [Hyaloraphidium curvatum]|nr:hypothetical protein DFJ74DRAFT_720174 [Hyaloraphidium curvatum]